MSIKLSYSAAMRFKQCPQKYYHSLKYYSSKKVSALPFGSAIEEGVTELIQSRNLSKAIDAFTRYWTNEKASTKFPVYDNPSIEYSASDYDQNLAELAAEEIEKQFTALDLSALFPTWQEALDSLSEAYHKEAPLGESERKFVTRAYWSICRQRGIIMLESFAKDILPKIESIVSINSKKAIQYPISVQNDEGDQISGFVDYVLKLKDEALPVIIDCKTSSIEYSTHEIETSEQLRTYVQVLKKDLGPCKAGYLVLNKKIKFQRKCVPCDLEHSPQSKKCKKCKETLVKIPECKTQLIVTQYPDEFLDLIIDDYDNILSAIVNKVNYRNTQSCRLYNKPCEFYDVCWKNKNPEEIEHLVKKKHTPED